MTLEQRDVHRIRLPRCIEHIAQCWNGTEQRIDSNVDDHAHESKGGHLRAHRLENDVTREYGPGEISHARYETDYRIQPKLPLSSRNRNGIVEELAQYPYAPCGALRPGSRNFICRSNDDTLIGSAHLAILTSSADILFGPG